MNLKFNFGILKNKRVSFEWDSKGKKVKYEGIIASVKNKKDIYTFTFSNGEKLRVESIAFLKCEVKKTDDVINIIYNPSNELLSGFVGFAMSDTYGFPIEVTEEILEEKGIKIDMDSFNILKELQKELSTGTFKNKDGWNSK